ncbi:hypothetical protein RB601_000869 [Gaeumannomyces tritici]
MAQSGQDWLIAVERFNNSLPRGKDSKEFIDLDPQQPLSTDTIEVLATSISTLYLERKRRGRVPRILLRLVTVTSHAVLPLHGTAALPSDIVTKPLLALSRVLEDDSEAAEIVVKGIAVITEGLSGWKSHSEAVLSSEPVQKARVSLYVAILAFIQESKMLSSKWKKFSAFMDHSIRPTPLGKLRAKQRDIETAGDALEREVDRAENRVRHEALLEAMDTHRPVNQLYMSYLAALNRKYGTGEHVESMERPVPQSGKCGSTTGLATVQGLADTFEPNPMVPGDKAHSPADGTGEWFRNHPEFNDWLQDDKATLFWLTGLPGTGKSAIAQLALAILKSRGDALSFRFDPEEGPTSNTAYRTVASLVGELLLCLSRRSPLPESCKAPLERLLNLVKQHRNGRSSKFQYDEALSAFEELVRAQPVPTFVVIDALDECDPSGPRLFPHTPAKLVEDLVALSARSGLKIMIAARPVPPFHDLISMSPSIAITQELVGNDIVLVSKRLYTELRLPSDFQSAAITRIRAAAGASFLWATMLLHHAARPGIPYSQIEQSLNEFPEELISAYETSLDGQAKSRKFGEVQLERRRQVFVFLVAAQTSVTLEMITAALDFAPEHSAEHIYTLCRPLVTITGEKERHVCFHHHSAREFIIMHQGSTGHLCTNSSLLFSREEADALLAAKCLHALSSGDYDDLDLIAAILRQNNGPVNNETVTIKKENDGFYNYAAQFWSIHLAKVMKPPPELVQLAGNFLRMRQFVYWSEYRTQQDDDFTGIGSSRSRLGEFEKRLPDTDQRTLGLEDFFVMPYRDLADAYRERQEKDKVLQWLALRQLGFWYFFNAVVDKMADVRERVAKGLTEILGAEHPLTLRARSEVAFAYISLDEFEKAYAAYSEVAEVQRRVLHGDNRRELYTTLMHRGQAEYFLTHFSRSSRTQEEAVHGFLQVGGPTSHGYLSTRMWQACTLLQRGFVDESLEIMEAVHKTRKNRFGDDDGFAVYVEQHLGTIYRQLGRRARAVAVLEHSLATRKGGCSPGSNLVIDAELSLAVAYREFGELGAASRILAQVKEHLRREDGTIRYFEEYCQYVHVDALVQFEDGEREIAEQVLHAFVLGTDREKENRALLWARLDLADMMRARGEKDEALALFGGLVKPLVPLLIPALADTFDDNTAVAGPNRQDHETSSSSDPLSSTDDDGSHKVEYIDELDYDSGEELESPSVLAIAEDALKLVRDRKKKKAKQLLSRNGLEWARPKDLWLWHGVPPADTGSIRRLSTE